MKDDVLLPEPVSNGILQEERRRCNHEIKSQTGSEHWNMKRHVLQAKHSPGSLEQQQLFSASHEVMIVSLIHSWP